MVFRGGSRGVQGYEVDRTAQFPDPVRVLQPVQLRQPVSRERPLERRLRESDQPAVAKMVADRSQADVLIAGLRLSDLPGLHLAIVRRAAMRAEIVRLPYLMYQCPAIDTLSRFGANP